MKTFKQGDKVECNGNREGVFIRYYSDGMAEVRLWDGNRLVGDVCAPIEDIKLIQESVKN
jgi:hypothetical protein